MPVPLLDLQAQYGSLEKEVMAEIKEVIDSQRFIMGPKVTALEESIAAYCQCEFGIGVSSGTDALLIALMALEIGPGDEVITTPYTFFATGGCIARVGARPIFCDIDPVSYNISPTGISSWIESNTDEENGRLVNRSTGGTVKALMPVHLFGQTADMGPILELAQRYDLRVIEDAAQAIGAEYTDGSRAGSMGDIGCFSFFPSKNLGAFGDGGMCTTKDADIAERLRVLRAHGSKPKYYHALIGGNFRLDALQAAILSVKLKYLDRWTEGRQKNATYYDAALSEIPGVLTTPSRTTGQRHIYNQYVMRVRDRDGLREHLSAANIGNEVYYPVPLHMQQCFSSLGYQPEDCPESARAARETIAIPIYPELDDDQKSSVVTALADYCS
ncbi:MAG: DegT/DnrJ/EryC1/StrS family aminotransferase [Gammaproteobacteria bacterium]|nr:DegT/DnrJ/EryC1/StrS family aminotransferase [Gammaproteobacteria bacterium]